MTLALALNLMKSKRQVMRWEEARGNTESQKFTEELSKYINAGASTIGVQRTKHATDLVGPIQFQQSSSSGLQCLRLVPSGST